MLSKEKLAAFRDATRPNCYELKFYPAPGGKKAPFALIAPGGGYGIVCSFVEGEPFARELNRRGYSAFVLYYRVRKKARYPKPQEDMARALKEILDNAEKYNVEPTGFSVWGSSAGGHLAASFGTERHGYAHYQLPKPAALVLVYPVVTMGAHTHAGSRDNLLGKDASPEAIDALSIEKQVTAAYPCAYIWNTEDDELVPAINGESLAAALQEAGIPCQYHRYPHGPHGLGLALGTDCQSWFDEAVAFWEAQR